MKSYGNEGLGLGQGLGGWDCPMKREFQSISSTFTP